MAKRVTFIKDFDFWGPGRRWCVAYKAGTRQLIPEDHFKAALAAGVLDEQS